MKTESHPRRTLLIRIWGRVPAFLNISSDVQGRQSGKKPARESLLYLEEKVTGPLFIAESVPNGGGGAHFSRQNICGKILKKSSFYHRNPQTNITQPSETVYDTILPYPQIFVKQFLVFFRHFLRFSMIY
jgi:hypothetical protein